MKILLVDDDQMNGKLLQKRLNKRGFECDHVDNGADCLMSISTNSYVLVLLDIMMPDMSGIEVLDKIRKDKNKVDLPIIMVTAKSDTSDIVEALKKEANDYLTKPVNIDIATARINTQLQMNELVTESLKAQKLSTVNSMVTTLNHEINNPLSIAVGNLHILKGKLEADEKKLERVDKSLNALNRITEIVKKIEEISQGQVDIEEVDYSGKTKMLKVK